MVHGAAGGRPIAVIGVTVSRGRIVAIDVIADVSSGSTWLFSTAEP
ncbi:hypothetical protein [Nonomuraea purpurea]